MVTPLMIATGVLVLLAVVIQIFSLPGIRQLKRLVKIFQESKIDSLEITWLFGGKRVSFNRVGQRRAVLTADATMSSVFGEVTQPLIQSKKLQVHQIASQFAGTFKLSLTEFDAPLIQVGGLVKEGDVIGYVASREVDHELKSTASGVVSSILVAEGQLVHSGDVIVNLKV